MSETVLNLPIKTYGAHTNAFSTIQTDAGTAPVATGPLDTLTLTSSDGSVVITGNATTDTIDITGAGVLPGHVVGPASATDSAIALFDTSTGKLIKNSDAVFTGSNLSLAGNLGLAGTLTTTPGTFLSSVADGASNIAYNFDTVNPLVADGVKLASFKQNGTEVAFIGRQNTQQGLWANKMAAGSLASINKYSTFEINDVLDVDFSMPNGTSMFSIKGDMAITGSIKQAAAFGVDVSTSGNGVLPFMSGMLFQINHGGTGSVGANKGVWGQEPALIASRWKSSVGSISLGAWVTNIVAGTPLFSGGKPSNEYVGFAANKISSGIGIPKPIGLYIHEQQGTTLGMGIFIKKASHFGILMQNDGAGSNIGFGTNKEGDIQFDATNMLYNSRVTGTGNHSFTGGSIQAVDGSGAEAGYGFNTAVNTGMFISSPTSLNLTAAGLTGINILETTSGTYVNVGLGSGASSNDSYILQCSRTQNASTYLNISNNSNALSASSTLLLSNGAYEGKIHQFGVGPTAATPSYYQRLAIEAAGSTTGISFITKSAGKQIDFFVGSRAAAGLNASFYDDYFETLKGRRRGITTITSADSPYTVLATDDFLEIDATSGNVIVNFLSASVGGANFATVRKDNSANTVTLTRNGTDTIAGDTSVTMNNQYEILKWQSNGADTWY